MRKLRLLLSIIICSFLFSCEDYSYKGNPHLIINVSDSASLKFTSVTTSIGSVELYNGTNWWTLDANSITFDVMLLTGKEYLTIVDEDIPEGHYSKIRVNFQNDNNYITVYGDKNSYKMESDSLSLIWESDILLDAKVDDLTVQEIDIDLNKAVKYDSIYRFNPSRGCRIIDAEACGAVYGIMVDESEQVIYSVVQIKAYQDDSLYLSTYSNTSNGKFFFRLPGGIYDVEFLSQLDSTYLTMKYEDVIVEDGKVSSLDKVTLETLDR